jgi:hypothetical protein
MTLAERLKSLRRKPVAREQLVLGMDEAVFERLATKMRCAMFLSGMCMGGAMTALYLIHAYRALSLVIAFEVVWIAWRGWPWEM